MDTRLRRVQRLPDAAQRRGAADRRVRDRPSLAVRRAILAIRARVPLDVLTDTIQPFPTFSEIYVDALKALHAEIANEPVGVESK